MLQITKELACVCTPANKDVYYVINLSGHFVFFNKCAPLVYRIFFYWLLGQSGFQTRWSILTAQYTCLSIGFSNNWNLYI